MPFAAFLFSGLPGRGLVLARPLGLILVGYPVWLLASLDAVPYGTPVCAAAIGVLVVLGCLLWRRAGVGPALRGQAGRLFVAGELLFALAFFGWAAMRSFSPDVWQTEKPMDMAFVNAVDRSESFPPHDPWQSGENLNYYYFGHYLVAFLGRLTAVEPAVGFNLGVALFFALCVTAVFGVASALCLALRGARPGGTRAAVLTGLVGVGLAMLLGNLAGGIQFLEGPTLAGYDWWSPSRVIAGTANEFPYFSFLLADLHAHVMATPFTLVAVAYALQLALRGPPAWRGGVPGALGELALASLVLGVLYAVNALDYPTAAVLGALALLIWASPSSDRVTWRRAAVWALAWLGASLLLFLPFHLDYSTAASGLGIVGDHDNFTRFAADVLLIYGLPLWILLAVAVTRLSLPVRYVVWGGTVAVFVLVLLAPARLAGLLLLLVLVACSLFIALRSRSTAAERFFWLLVTVGLGLIAVGEIVYIEDVFQDTPSYRFNTVFKAGYQAWFLLAIAASVAVFAVRRRVPRPAGLAWKAGVVVLVAIAALYPVAASYSRSTGFSEPPTLDGERWLTAGDAAAIRWLRANVEGTPTILEDAGADYSPEGHARVSTFTGLPAVIGWAGHEIQWDHDPGTRATDVARIYETLDPGVARRLLERYGVRYVFVGSLERDRYSPAALAKFERLGRKVFEFGDTAVYELPSR